MRRREDQPSSRLPGWVKCRGLTRGAESLGRAGWCPTREGRVREGEGGPDDLLGAASERTWTRAGSSLVGWPVSRCFFFGFKAYSSSTQARRGIAQRPTDLVLRDPRSRRGPLHTKRVPIEEIRSQLRPGSKHVTDELCFFSVSLLTKQVRQPSTDCAERCACIQVVEVTISGR